MKKSEMLSLIRRDNGNPEIVISVQRNAFFGSYTDQIPVDDIKIENDRIVFYLKEDINYDDMK